MGGRAQHGRGARLAGVAPAFRVAFVAAFVVAAGSARAGLVAERSQADGDRSGDVATDVVWRHCEVRQSGQQQPAWPCVAPRLVASAPRVTVPASGDLEVTLDADGVPPGSVMLSVEALLYPREGDDLEAHRQSALSSFAKVVRSAAHDRVLAHAFGGVLRFEPVRPRQHLLAPAFPRTLRVRFPGVPAGRTAMYAVWAYPTQLAGERRVSLRPLTVAAGDGLRLAFAVPEAGWKAGSPPVRFDVEASVGGAPGRVVWTRRLEPSIRSAERGWQRAEIDLAAVAGAPVSFTLVTRSEGDPGAPAFATWARPIVLRRRDDPRPNLVLISLDTLRADHLGTYGYSRPTSPGIDRLAADAVVFEHAVSTFPSTTASHMSMFTSLPACAHGVLAPGATLAPGIATVAESLAAAGYRTAAITEDALIKGDIGFNRGFDEYRDLVWTGDTPTGLFPEVAALGRRWLEANAEGPFFLFLHTYQPHTPFKVPPQYRAAFVLPEGAPELRRRESEYDAGIRGTDDVLTDLVGWLERRGLLERTVLMVTSDHGTEFGEHGGEGHARGVDVVQNHVPLIVRHPSRPAPRRIATPVGLADLAPTLLALAGVDAPATFAGRSLLPALRGEGALPGRPVFSDQMWGKRQTVLRRGRWAWVQTATAFELFDMPADPTQQRDVAAAHPALAARGKARIAAYRKACTKTRLRLRSGKRAGPLDPQRVRSLRALGYLE
jgi:arylsulfatase A-like enzyme